MRYQNTVKVGLTIVVAIVLVILGIRFMQGIPLRGTYDLYTEFDRVDGLIPGNSVSANGVTIGSVTSVHLNPETQRVRVAMRINRGTAVPEGTTAEQTGISAVGAVQVSFTLGPSDNPSVPTGGYVPSASKPDIFTTLVERVDSTLIGTQATFQQMAQMLQEPTSDLMRALSSAANLTDILARTVQLEHQRVSAILANLEAATGRFDGVVARGDDSLAAVIGSLNNSLDELQRTLVQVQSIGTDARGLLEKINRGEGSLGLLINNPSLYQNLDSTAVNMNRLLVDLRLNPGRYLRELKVVDLF